MKKEKITDLSIGIEFDEGTTGYHELWFNMDDIQKIDTLVFDVSNVETLRLTFLKSGEVE